MDENMMWRKTIISPLSAHLSWVFPLLSPCKAWPISRLGEEVIVLSLVTVVTLHFSKFSFGWAHAVAPRGKVGSRQKEDHSSVGQSSSCTRSDEVFVVMTCRFLPGHCLPCMMYYSIVLYMGFVFFWIPPKFSKQNGRRPVGVQSLVGWVMLVQELGHSSEGFN